MPNILEQMRLERRITLIFLIIALAIMLLLDAFTSHVVFSHEETTIEDSDAQFSSPDNAASTPNDAPPAQGSNGAAP